VLHSQKAEILRLCQAAGLKPSDFSLRKTKESDDNWRLVHKPTKCWYELGVDVNDGSFEDLVFPGENDPEEDYHPKDWKQRYVIVSKWAARVGREAEAKGYLDIVLNEQTDLATAHLDKGNEPFSQIELLQVLERLSQVEEHVLEVKKLASDQAAEIKHEFEMLRVESKRAGKDAWLRMLVGTLLDIGKQFFTKEQAIAIWNYASNTFSGAIRAITHH